MPDQRHDPRHATQGRHPADPRHATDGGRRTRAEERAEEIDIRPTKLLADIEGLRGQLAEAKTQSEEYLAALQRERAEFLNFKRRTAEERERDLGLAGETEGKGRDADALAYFREAVEFRNLQIVELPKGDFAFTIARQFLFDVFSLHQLEFLQKSANTDVAGIAAKGYKEVRYHVRHSSEWLQRLGDGTEESHERAQKAVNELWRFTGEMFAPDEVDTRLSEAGVAPDLGTIQPKWRAMVSDVIERATLSIPSDAFMLAGGRSGRHTEYLGHMLSEMQIVARSHPGASW